MASTRVVVLLALVCAAMVFDAVEARSGRMLQQQERPGHDYATSVGMLASTSAIQKAVTVKGGRPEHIKAAAELSLKNAQTNTKFWPKGTRYDDGVKMSKEAEDGDRD